MSKKIGMMSLGCPKNQCDAELMMFKLREAGFELVEDVAKADLAIVNTCGFIESAKSEAIEEIVELGKLKAEGTIDHIVVTGCLAERYRDDILEEMPEVDAVVGIGKNADIVSVCQSVLDGERLSAYGEKCDMPLDGGRIVYALCSLALGEKRGKQAANIIGTAIKSIMLAAGIYLAAKSGQFALLFASVWLIFYRDNALVKDK